MSRPLAVGTMAGHLAACLEAGLTFEWNRRRLGIDAALEGKVRIVVQAKPNGGTPCEGNVEASKEYLSSLCLKQSTVDSLTR